jgi:hypothetical protein
VGVDLAVDEALERPVKLVVFLCALHDVTSLSLVLPREQTAHRARQSQP